MGSDWVVVVPFRAKAAKTRFGPHDNTELALAMALDTVEAALQVARVTVVTDSAAGFIALGADVHPDPGAGLNAAIVFGLASLDVGTPRAVLLGDHPGLTPTELIEALTAATAPLSMVSDNSGIGTAFTAALPGVLHHPHYGQGSKAAHEAAGYVSLDGQWPGLRSDVDHPYDLASLTHLGSRTSAWRLEREPNAP